MAYVFSESLQAACTERGERGHCRAVGRTLLDAGLKSLVNNILKIKRKVKP